MQLTRQNRLKYYVILPVISVFFLVVVTGTLSFVIKLKPARALLSRIPVVNQWVEPKEKLLAAKYDSSASDNENGSGLEDTSGVTDPVVTKQNLKVGALKKDTIQVSGEATQGQDVTLTAQISDSHGNISTKSVTSEVKLCKAGKLYAWAYLTLPDRPSKNMRKAPIKSPFLTMGYPFATFPVVQEDNIVFATAPKSAEQVIKDLTELGKAYAGKHYIDKEKLVDYYTDLFVFYYKALTNKKKSDGFAAVLNSYLNPILPLGATDPTNMYLAARLPGELLQGTNYSVNSVREAYHKLFEALVFGPNVVDKNNQSVPKYVQDMIDVNTPEYKACRNFIDKPVTDFHFILETTVVVPDKNKKGLFIPAGSSNTVGGFLKPPSSCSGGDCFILLKYNGDAARVFFNQLGVCTAALAKYNGLTRLPQQKPDNVANSSCEGLLCNSHNSAQDLTLNAIARSNTVYDISRQIPLSLAVINNNTSLVKRVADHFNLVSGVTNILKFMFTTDETGLYNSIPIANGGYKKPYASIPIPVECTCPKASADAILSKVLVGVPKPLRVFYKPAALVYAKALSASGHGVVWNCSFDAGALVLSSTFDTPEHKSHAAVSYNTFTQKLEYFSLLPGDPLKCPWYKIAQALGHLNGELPDDLINDKTKEDTRCSVDAIKQAYDARLLSQPIFIHQKALFTICPPEKTGVSLPVGAPSFLTSGCQKNKVAFSVYSLAAGPMQITRMMAAHSKLPGSKQTLEQAEAAWKVINCMTALYSNMSVGHMEFSVDPDTKTIESEFASDTFKCAKLDKKEIKLANEYFQIYPEQFKITGHFANPDGLFKKD